MSEACMSARCKKIIYTIISSEDYVPLQQICEEFKLSKRSVYYELGKINDWLTERGIPEIEVVRGKGIIFSDDIKRKIESEMENGNSQGSYIFSPMERIYFIICYIIHSKRAVSVDRLAECLQVSRNTIFNDMRVVVKQLQDYDLHLEYESKQGYLIKGDCTRIRALFIIYFKMLKPAYDVGALQNLVNDQARADLKKLREIESELNTEYIEGTLLAIALLVTRMEENNSELYFTSLKYDQLKQLKEYILVQKHFPELMEKERIYLCLHLLGSKVTANDVEIFNNDSLQSNYELAKALVAEFEKVACVTFYLHDEVERDIYAHLNASIYRYRYGIQVGNLMKEEIMKEYPEIFDLTKIACHYLEQQVGLPIGDSEVAYLTLKFATHLRREQNDYDKKMILNKSHMNSNEKIDIKELYGHLRKYIPKDKRDEFKDELVDFFQKHSPENFIFFEKKKKTLREVLIEDNILIEDEVSDWKDALTQAGAPLVNAGNVDESYIEEIIRQTQNYGPYMFITKDVVLAHAKPEGGVHKLGVAMSIYKSGVTFTNNHTAKIIIVLAAEDQEKHLRILKDIMEVFSAENSVQKLIACCDKKQVLAFVNGKIG